MSVSELIDLLKTFPADAELRYGDCYNDNTDDKVVASDFSPPDEADPFAVIQYPMSRFWGYA